MHVHVYVCMQVWAPDIIQMSTQLYKLFTEKLLQWMEEKRRVYFILVCKETQVYVLFKHFIRSRNNIVKYIVLTYSEAIINMYM